MNFRSFTQSKVGMDGHYHRPFDFKGGDWKNTESGIGTSHGDGQAVATISTSANVNYWPLNKCSCIQSGVQLMVEGNRKGIRSNGGGMNQEAVSVLAACMPPLNLMKIKPSRQL